MSNFSIVRFYQCYQIQGANSSVRTFFKLDEIFVTGLHLICYNNQVIIMLIRKLVSNKQQHAMIPAAPMIAAGATRIYTFLSIKVLKILHNMSFGLR